MAAEKVNYRGFKLYEDTTLSINLQAEQRPDMLERARERQEGIAFSSHQTRAACLRWLCWRWLPAQRRLIQCRDRSTRLLHVRSWPIRPLRRRARLSSIRVVTFCTWYRAADSDPLRGRRWQGRIWVGAFGYHSHQTGMAGLVPTRRNATEKPDLREHMTQLQSGLGMPGGH